MFLWPVFEYIKANKWAQIALVIVASIATLGIYLAIRDEGVKRRERARQEVERARERVAMIERKSQIVTEERHNADAALEARDSGPHYPDYDSLPDAHKAIAEGRARPR
jgi:uncharacterized membrane protein